MLLENAMNKMNDFTEMQTNSLTYAPNMEILTLKHPKLQQNVFLAIFRNSSRKKTI